MTAPLPSELIQPSSLVLESRSIVGASLHRMYKKSSLNGYIHIQNNFTEQTIASRWTPPAPQRRVIDYNG